MTTMDETTRTHRLLEAEDSHVAHNYHPLEVVVTGGSCSRAALACERHRAIALAPSTMTIRALAASAMGCLATRMPPFFGS